MRKPAVIDPSHTPRKKRQTTATCQKWLSCDDSATCSLQRPAKLVHAAWQQSTTDQTKMLHAIHLPGGNFCRPRVWGHSKMR
jgi:hypothetical protein